MKSVQPRDSGRERRQLNPLACKHFVPTRYREVVLTSSKRLRGRTSETKQSAEVSRRISFMKSSITKAIIQIVVIVTSVVVAVAQSKDVPRIWEAPLNIPTYE